MTRAWWAPLILLACHAADIQAQEPLRSGLWIESGRGSGAARNACSGCEDVSVAYGSASHLRAGGRVSQTVLVGVELFALDASAVLLGFGAEPVEAENVSLAPIVIWYIGGGGVFLKAGAGVARGNFTVRTVDGEPTTTRRTGSGLTFGVGFDAPLGRWLALTANLGTYVTAIGDVRLDGEVIDDVISTMYGAAIAITIR